MAEATAARLGGVAGTGVEVGSDADLARAVAAGFNVKAIDALRQSGVTGGELGTLIIKPRTLSHRRTNGGRLTVDESDRAARVARGLAVAGRTFANREKAARWLHRSVPGLALPGRPRRPQTVHAGEPGSPSVGSPFALTKKRATQQQLPHRRRRHRAGPSFRPCLWQAASARRRRTVRHALRGRR